MASLKLAALLLSKMISAENQSGLFMFGRIELRVSFKVVPTSNCFSEGGSIYYFRWCRPHHYLAGAKWSHYISPSLEVTVFAWQKISREIVGEFLLGIRRCWHAHERTRLQTLARPHCHHCHAPHGEWNIAYSGTSRGSNFNFMQWKKNNLILRIDIFYFLIRSQISCM